MIIEVSSRFHKAYANLPGAIQKKVKKAILLLERDPRHPSLNLEKIDHERGIWSGRVDRSYRFTFQWMPGGLRLRQVGAHEQAYRAP
jgi:mRNA-degrading endonuclease RelE of RelBE toxin-antitoxin system